VNVPTIKCRMAGWCRFRKVSISDNTAGQGRARVGTVLA